MKALCLLLCLMVVFQMCDAKVVILLGAPGSGKGTQAVRLSKELSIPHISTGDLFRENISKETELGKKAKSYTNEGKLVPDEIVLEMLFDRVSRPDAVKGYLLDGFPRTIAQAEALEKRLGEIKPTVLDLEVPNEVILKRALGRLNCGSCGEMFNEYFSPPQQKGICDKCAGELKKRADDTLEVIEERLRVYHEQTKPLESFYEKRGLLHRVDGTKSPDDVYQSLLEKLKLASN